jgi:predicted esterase
MSLTMNRFEGWRTLSVLLCFAGCSSSPPPTQSNDLGRTPDLPADLGQTTPCTGVTGDFHSQPFSSGGETRYYFLHVPADYSCSQAWPLLVDFHGTGSGAPTDPVEESWAFPEMLEAADSEHFIVVRPRSRYAPFGGSNVFQWDINPGDPKKNLTYATELIADLKARYHIDDQRVYASGFSNGPSQALQFLAVDPPIVHGYMVVSGGLNAPLTRSTPLPANVGRIYVMVGFRDYMWPTTRTLFDFLDAHGFASEGLWQRKSNTGHELYGWHYHEAFGWLDRGQRPPVGTLAAGWQREALPGQESLIALAQDPAGRYNAAAEGAMYRRALDGTWTRTATLGMGSAPTHVNGLCFQPDGTGLAVGETNLYTTSDGSSWLIGTPVPAFDNKSFNVSYMNGIACGGQTVAAGGLWTAAVSQNGGTTWSAGSMSVDAAGDKAFVTVVRRSKAGTWIAAGYYDYLGRSTDGTSFTEVAAPVNVQWLNDVGTDDAGRWWAVGEKGTVVTSSDDGLNWEQQAIPTSEDLYAVAFGDANRGITVGAHGAAFLTRDGGATWSDVSTGLDGYLGAATWLDPHTALVVGEAGTALTLAVP